MKLRPACETDSKNMRVTAQGSASFGIHNETGTITTIGAAGSQITVNADNDGISTYSNVKTIGEAGSTISVTASRGIVLSATGSAEQIGGNITVNAGSYGILNRGNVDIF